MTYMRDTPSTPKCRAKSMMGCYGSVHIIYGVNIKLHIVLFHVIYGSAILCDKVGNTGEV